MARIGAGELDRRIQFWRAALVDDGTARVPGTPAPLGTVQPAKKTDASDGERMRAAQLGQELTSRFLVRVNPLTRTITAKDFLTYRGQTFEITGAKDSPERDDAIEITAVARPDIAL